MYICMCMYIHVYIDMCVCIYIYTRMSISLSRYYKRGLFLWVPVLQAGRELAKRSGAERSNLSRARSTPDGRALASMEHEYQDAYIHT